MKPLTQRKKEDLVEIFRRFELDLPEGDFTKQDLLMSLQAAGIDNRKVALFESKEEKENKYTESNTMVIVRMDRQNVLFQYGQFKFTKNKPYQLMSSLSARDLVQKFPGFHVASPEEVEDYYRR